MDNVCEIEGNEYLNAEIGERFVVQRVEEWVLGLVAIMEYEDGVRHDEPAQWVPENCELLETDATPVDLTFYTEKGVLDKAHKMGQELASPIQDRLSDCTDHQQPAVVFRDTVRSDSVETQRGRTLSEEIDRFAETSVDRQTIVEEAWRGFSAYASGFVHTESPPSKRELTECKQIATE